MNRLPDYYAQVYFENCFNEAYWRQILKANGLRGIRECQWYTPWLGDNEPIVIKDPPNLLAEAPNKSNRSLGVIRCSRFFFEKDFSNTAEISFQGHGRIFRSIAESVAAHVGGDLLEGPPPDFQ